MARENKKSELLELILEDTLDGIRKESDKKIEDLMTSFEAKIDGTKVELQNAIKECYEIIGAVPTVINTGTIAKPKKQLCHSQFKTITKILQSAKRKEKNIMIVGGAGSGKTHLVSMIADAMKLKFYPMSVGLQTTKSDLLGFIDAHGNYHTTPIREAFEKGGVLLLDEFDASHAGVATILNSLLANGHCSFPDGIITKHKDFICICACNTYGHGGTTDYVGRNRLDGATLDRFITVNVDYDKKLEKSLTQNDDWYNIINKIRTNIEKTGTKLIVSPRASMDGADLLDIGFSVKDVLDMVVFKGASKDIKTKLLKGVDISIISKDSISIKTYSDYDIVLRYIVDNDKKEITQDDLIVNTSSILDNTDTTIIKVEGEDTFRINEGNSFSLYVNDSDWWINRNKALCSGMCGNYWYFGTETFNEYKTRYSKPNNTADILVEFVDTKGNLIDSFESLKKVG